VTDDASEGDDCDEVIK